MAKRMTRRAYYAELDSRKGSEPGPQSAESVKFCAEIGQAAVPGLECWVEARKRAAEEAYRARLDARAAVLGLPPGSSWESIYAAERALQEVQELAALNERARAWGLAELAADADSEQRQALEAECRWPEWEERRLEAERKRAPLFA